jgi:hypothetical protein
VKRVGGARLAETSDTPKQDGTISLWAAVLTVGKLTGPPVTEEEDSCYTKTPCQWDPTYLCYKVQWAIDIRTQFVPEGWS